jgi:hypothetical protein
MEKTQYEWQGGKNLATAPAIWRRVFADIPSDYFGLNDDPSHLVLQQIGAFRQSATYLSQYLTNRD